MQPAKIEIPEPRSGRQQVIIVSEVNGNEYHTEVIIVTEEPIVSVEIRDLLDLSQHP